MKINCNSVVYDGKNWYYGRLHGWNFNIINEVKYPHDVDDIDKYKTLYKFLLSLDYKVNVKSTVINYLKELSIMDWSNEGNVTYFKEITLSAVVNASA